MNNRYRIFVINPGSTSTKVAVFKGTEKLLAENVSHAAEDLAKFAEVSDQLQFRYHMILDMLEEHKIDLSDLDAVVGRGGGLMPCEGGVYGINEVLFDHASRGANGVQHPAQLGPQIAKTFADEYGCPAFVVNPPDTDEAIPEARITGIKGVLRRISAHALNQKETAIVHSRKMGVRYEDMNYVVCHIGGGISVTAHRKGKMIDSNDLVSGDGPMTPTRSGSVQLAQLVDYVFDNGLDRKTAKAFATKTGGFVDLLGTSDAREVYNMVQEGNKFAQLCWNAMIYQIIKQVGAMAAALHGKVDAILMSGGMVYNEDLVSKIKEGAEFIAPIYTYPGEYEMEAMANGAARVLDGEEELKTYTGEPIINMDDFLPDAAK